MTDAWIETPDSAGFFPAASAAIPIGDRGLTYGDGLFETVRVLNGAPLFIDRHLARLTAGLAEINLPTPWGAESLIARCHYLIARNGLADGILRLTLTRGPGTRGFAPPSSPSPTLILQTFGPPAPGPREGLSAVMAPWRVDPANPLCRVKHLAGLDKVLAKDLARRRNADEILFMNIHGHLTEAAAWNLFVVREGQVLTPARHSGLLPGITRQIVIDRLAPALGYRIIETELGSEALATAAEAFLTNAASGLRGLIAFEGRPIGDGAPGPVTGRLAAAYEDYCRKGSDDQYQIPNTK